MARDFPSVADEERAYARQEGTAQRRTMRRLQATPLAAQLVGELHDEYPWMSEGVLLALASKGYGVDHPMTQFAANYEKEREADEDAGGGLFGDIGALVSKPVKFAGEVLSDVGGLVDDPLKFAVRSGFALIEAPFQEFTGRVGELVSGTGEALSRAGTGVGTAIGAGAGALAGSVIPGVGTAIGAGAGGVIGGAIGGFAGDVLGGGDTEAFSRAGVAVENVLEGRGTQLGHGFFPGGEAAKEQARRMRALGQAAGLENQGFTVGRYFARKIVEPGTAPYQVLSGLVDAGSQLAADPAFVLGKSSTAIRQARRTFIPLEKTGALAQLERFGALPGVRNTTLPERVDQWMNSEDALPVLRWMAGEKDWARMWRLTGRGNIDHKIINELVDAEDVDAVKEILRPELGISIREKPRLKRVKQAGEHTLFRGKSIHDVRLFGTVPGSYLDVERPNDVVENIDRFLRNAKVDAATRSKHLEGFARAENREEMYQSVRNVMSEVEERLAGIEGIDRRKAQSLTTMTFDRWNEARAYFIDANGNGVEIPGYVRDPGAVATALSEPHLFVEALNRTLPLPDYRAIRDHTSKWGRFRKAHEMLPEAAPLGVKGAASRATDLPLAWIESASQKIWKPLALLRGAWTIRVVGEEQVRLAAVGKTSMFNHPIDHILYAIATPQGRVSRRVAAGAQRLGTKAKPKGVEDVLGQLYTDGHLTDFQDALSRSFAGWRDKPAGTVLSRNASRYTREAPEYANAWAEELATLAADPIAQRVAHGSLFDGDLTPGEPIGIQGIKDWFFDGGGRTFREELMANPKRAGLANRSEADAYIDSIAERIAVKTANNGDLVDVIASGKWNGKNFHGVDSQTGKPFIDAELRAELRRRADDGRDVGYVKGDIVERSREDDSIDKAVDWIVSSLMAKPTNFLSRSPAFRQFYEQRIDELTEAIDTGLVSKVEADELAKGFALDEVKGLLYDLSERSQFFDIAKVIFPFGEAWKEVLGVWAKIGWERPQVFRRAQQAIGSPAQNERIRDDEGKLNKGAVVRVGSEIGTIVGEARDGGIRIRMEEDDQVHTYSEEAVSRGPTASTGARGYGFFYTNDNGEEVFAYPGSQFLTQQLIGVPIPLEGRVQGLSIATEVLPGFGPAITVPAAYLLPDTPDYDSVRDILFPFGERDTHDPISSIMPAWLSKWRTAWDDARSPDQQRLFANTVMHIASYLATKNGRPETEVEMRKLLDDAKQKATRFWIIRGTLQFGAPTAPAGAWMAEDKDGTLTLAHELRDEFHRLLDKKGPDAATDEFLGKHGEGAFLLTQGMTKSLVYGSPVTTDAIEWARQNPRIREALPNTYGLFAPAGGDFDYDAYIGSLTNKDREALTPEEFTALASNRVARNRYEEAKAKVGPNPNEAARTWLALVRQVIENEYQTNLGFGGVPGLAKKASPEVAMKELERAVLIPEIANSSAGKALALYMQAREKALASAQSLGLKSFASAKAARPVRDWLRTVGGLLSARYEGFGALWDQLLEREMTDDVDLDAIAGRAA